MKIPVFLLVLALIGSGLSSPGSLRAVDVLAPYWAYQIGIGMRLAELRTVAGKRYTGVTVEAMDQQRIQFTHSRGRSVEFLVSILDPNLYVGAGGAPQNGAPQNVQPRRTAGGPLALMMTAREREATGVDKLEISEQSVLKRWLSYTSLDFPSAGTGTHKLDRQEQQALGNWLAQKHSALHAADGPGVPIQLPIKSWISGRDFTGFQQGRIFQLGNGQSWQQTDQTAAQFYPDVSGKPIHVHIRASGAHYLMSVQGAGEIFVKPVQ